MGISAGFRPLGQIAQPRTAAWCHVRSCGDHGAAHAGDYGVQARWLEIINAAIQRTAAQMRSRTNRACYLTPEARLFFIYRARAAAPGCPTIGPDCPGRSVLMPTCTAPVSFLFRDGRLISRLHASIEPDVFRQPPGMVA